MTNELDDLPIYEEHAGLRAISPAKVLEIWRENQRLDERLETQKGVIVNHVEAERILNAEIERLRKALDNRGRQLGIQPTVHEPEKQA